MIILKSASKDSCLVRFILIINKIYQSCFEQTLSPKSPLCFIYRNPHIYIYIYKFSEIQSFLGIASCTMYILYMKGYENSLCGWIDCCLKNLPTVGRSMGQSLSSRHGLCSTLAVFPPDVKSQQSVKGVELEAAPINIQMTSKKKQGPSHVLKL